MSHTIRFPLLAAKPSVGPDESASVITILLAATTLYKGGGDVIGAYTPINALKTIMRNTESPFVCAALEITASAAMTIGNGTFAEQIGLFGGILLPGGTTIKTLIGVLGIARGGAAPQIPIVVDPSATLVGFTQKVSDVTLYDSLSIGGVAGDITIAEGETITVTIRPIRGREYLG